MLACQYLLQTGRMNFLYSSISIPKLIWFSASIVEICFDVNIQFPFREDCEAQLSKALMAIKKKPEGVYVQASTLGSLEALLEFLRVWLHFPETFTVVIYLFRLSLFLFLFRFLFTCIYCKFPYFRKNIILDAKNTIFKRKYRASA